MEPSSSEREATEDARSRAFQGAFGALVLGCCAALAVGGAPLWVERTVAGLLWFVVLFFLALMAVLSWWMHRRPLSDKLRRLQEEEEPMTRPGGWIGTLTGKVLLLLIVVLLLAAGRHVLAGFYVGLLPAGIGFVVSNNRCVHGFTRSQVSPLNWAVYRALRTAFLAVKWLFWVLPLFAAQVRLFQTGARLGGGLIGTLGLPRPLAAVVYRPRLRWLWLDLLPTAFWLLCAGLALGLAFAPLGPDLATLAAGLLWAGGGFVAAVSIVAGLLVSRSGGSGGVKLFRRRRSFSSSAAELLRVALQVAVLAALTAAGLYSLVACYFGVMAATALAARFGAPAAKDGGS